MNVSEELKKKLERFLPIAIVVRLDGDEVQGRVEHSFSMDWDPSRVRVFWSGKAYSILGEHQLSGTEDARHNMNKLNANEFMFDLLAEDSPIEVNLERWLADLSREPGDKFTKRNAPFTVKVHGLWQLRALAAERKLNELEPLYRITCKRLGEQQEMLDKISSVLSPEEVTTGD